MSSCNRRFILTALPATLAACGFTPAYAPGGGASALQNAVLIDDPNDRDSFQLVKQLEARLGRPGTARYGLGFALTTRSDGVAVTRDQATTRFNLLGSATYALRDLQTAAVVHSGKTSAFTGYSTTGSTVATLAAERDAYARLMVILADQIVAQLTAAARGFAA